MTPDRPWGDVAVGEQLPAIVDEITYRRVVMNPGATWDYFPGHYDPDYARSQGQPTIYANSLHLFGLLDRAATEWAGPGSFLVRRAVRLQLSMYAGDTVTVAGRVTDKRDPDLVDLELAVTNATGGTCCTATLTLRLAETT
jgi:acyl dehydratase